MDKRASVANGISLETGEISVNVREISHVSTH